MVASATPHPIEFIVTSSEPRRFPIEVDGRPAAAVLSQLITVAPGEVSRTYVRALVESAVRIAPNDPESPLEVDIPGLEGVDGPNPEELEQRIGQTLNRYGVSVVDWPPYDFAE